MASHNIGTAQPRSSIHTKPILQAVLRWLAVVLWMGIIFVLSDIPSLASPFEPFYDFVLRKLAHVTEYGILTALLVTAFRLHARRDTHALVMATIVAVFYAFSDEWHQSFVPGREGSLRDLGVDALGVGASLAFTRRNKL